MNDDNWELIKVWTIYIPSNHIKLYSPTIKSNAFHLPSPYTQKLMTANGAHTRNWILHPSLSFSNRSGLCYACSAAAPVVMFSLTVVPLPECNGVKHAEPFRFLGIDHTLRRSNLVAYSVVAIGVCHLPLPETLHLHSLKASNTSRDIFRTLGFIAFLWYLFNRIHCTTV